MNKLKRMIALLAVIALVLCAVLTLVFALLDYNHVGNFTSAWKACAWAMIVLPVLLYAMLFIYNVIDKRNKENNK